MSGLALPQIGLGLRARRLRSTGFAIDFGTAAASYPGLTAATTGTIYLQSSELVAALASLGATDPLVEYRGATVDRWGSGSWVFPSSTNLAANPFVFGPGGGWSTQGFVTYTTSSIIGPTGTAMTKLSTPADGVTPSNEGLMYCAGASSTLRTFSVWYVTDPTTPPLPGFFAGVLTLTSDASFCLPAAPTLTRFAVTSTVGMSYLGLTPSGLDVTGAGVNSTAGATHATAYSAVEGPHDLPLIVGSASAAKQLDAAHAGVVSAIGDLDFEVCVMSASSWANEISGSYLWSTSTTDGTIAVRVVISGGFPTIALTVRGVDVLTSSSVVVTSSRPSEPYTVRAWYAPSTGKSGIRQSVAGATIRDTAGTTTGTALARPAGALYLGSALGSATGAFVGRIRALRRPAGAPGAVQQVEVIMIGDSTSGPVLGDSVGVDAVGSYIYTGSEWDVRPGIGVLAQSGATPADQLAAWNAYTQWHGLASVKAYAVMCGINAIIGGADAAAVLASLQGLVTQLRADNSTAKVILSTMMPARAWAAMTVGDYAVWQSVNASIRGGAISGVDMLMDFASVAGPYNDGNDNLVYDSGDHVHQNIAGRQRLGGFLVADPAYSWRGALRALGVL